MARGRAAGRGPRANGAARVTPDRRLDRARLDRRRRAPGIRRLAVVRRWLAGDALRRRRHRRADRRGARLFRHQLAPQLCGRPRLGRRFPGARARAEPCKASLHPLRLLAAGRDIVVIAGAAALEYRDEGFGRLPGMLGTAAIVTFAVAVVLFAWSRRERRRAERLAALQRAMRVESENPHE